MPYKVIEAGAINKHDLELWLNGNAFAEESKDCELISLIPIQGRIFAVCKTDGYQPVGKRQIGNQ